MVRDEIVSTTVSKPKPMVTKSEEITVDLQANIYDLNPIINTTTFLFWEAFAIVPYNELVE
mgnify:FL=1